MVKRELGRLLKAPVTYACIIIYMGVLFLGIIEDLRAGSSIGWFEQFWLSENFGVACLIGTLIFPIAAAFGCYEERKGHYDWLVMMRSGYPKYCRSRVAAVVIGSMLMYVVSVALTVTVGSVFFPLVYRASNSEQLASYFPGGLWVWIAGRYGYWTSFFLYVLLNSLSVGIFSMVAVCVSVYSTNRYVICALPFFLYRIGTYLGGVLSRTAYSPFGRELQADGGAVNCIIMNLLAYLVLGYLYYFELKWRRTHG